MKRSYFCIALVTFVVLANFAVFHATAQPPARTAMRPDGGAKDVALLDVSYVIKNHKRFKTKMEEMKEDVKREEALVKQKRDAIKKLIQQINDYRKGTPDYKAIEEEVTKRQADLSVGVQLSKRKFLEQEAKIYYGIYQEITQEVEYYCKNHGITMVLRFNGDPANPDQPESVLRDINKPVVYYPKDSGIDITPFILESLNSRSLRGGAAARRHGVTPRQR